MLLLILIGFIHTPYDITKMDSAAKLAAPSLKHLMGCDNFGRDIFLHKDNAKFRHSGKPRTLHIVHLSIFDKLSPSILLALVFVSLFGTGKYNVIGALGIAFIPSFARIVRGELTHTCLGKHSIVKTNHNRR